MAHRLGLLLALLVGLLPACGALERPAAALPTPAPSPTYRVLPPIRTAVSHTVPLYPGPATAVPPRLRTFANGTQEPYPPPELTALAAATPEPTPLPPTLTPIPLVMPPLTGTLLRELWPPPAHRPPVRTLYYTTAERRDHLYHHTLWRLDLNNPTQPTRLREIAAEWWMSNGATFGTLSPDGQHIAYLLRGDSTAELHVVRRDGQDDRVVASRLAGSTMRGLNRFVWSPDSTRLAFMKHWERGQDFYVYDLRSGAEPERIARGGGADLGFWLDNQQVVVYLVTDRRGPLQLTAINVTTQQQQALALFPRYGTFTTEPAPDGTRLLLAEYLFDPATHQFTPFPSEEGYIALAWGPDSRSFFVLDRPEDGDTWLVPLDPATPPTRLRLLPPYPVTDLLTLEDVAPDGQYLVVEFSHVVGNAVTLDYLLYDVRQDRWLSLSTGKTSLHVVGWE